MAEDVAFRGYLQKVLGNPYGNYPGPVRNRRCILYVSVVLNSEFKLEAWNPIRDRSVSVRQASLDLTIHENTLRA